MEIKSIFSTTHNIYIRNKLMKKTVAFYMLLFFSLNTFSEIIPDPANIGTKVTKTVSGIDQIDIAKPSGNGTSYNSLMELQVGERGLVLNNSRNVVTETEIAGLIARNRNLDNGIEANLIIAEIKGKNRTDINGYVEVAGKKADVIIANRNGIAVNGGGFLNSDRVTLTTGRLNIENGDIKSIEVSEGNIQIGEKGIDALNLSELELIGKTIDVAGLIKGSKDTRILISSGSQTYEYRTKEIKSKGETYTGIAVDGKSAGSMYAGKIDIISNDKGAGVNTKGDLVSINDVTITADGEIRTKKSESERQVAQSAAVKKIKTKKVNSSVKTVKNTVIEEKEPEINAEMITAYMKKALGKESFQEEVTDNQNGEGNLIKEIIQLKMSENNGDTISDGKSVTTENKSDTSLEDIKNIAVKGSDIREILSGKKDVESESMEEIMEERIKTLNPEKETADTIKSEDGQKEDRGTSDIDKEISEMAEKIFNNLEGEQIASEDEAELDIQEIADRKGYILANGTEEILEKPGEEILIKGVVSTENIENSDNNDKNVHEEVEITEGIQEKINLSESIILNEQMMNNRQGLIEGEIRNIRNRNFINISGETAVSEKIRIVTREKKN